MLAYSWAKFVPLKLINMEALLNTILWVLDIIGGDDVEN